MNPGMKPPNCKNRFNILQVTIEENRPPIKLPSLVRFLDNNHAAASKWDPQTDPVIKVALLPAVIAHAKTILPTPEFKATPPLVLLPETISDFLEVFLEDEDGRFFLRDHDDGDGRGTNTLIAPKGSTSTDLMLLLLPYINDGTNPKEVRPPAAAEAEPNDASKHETAIKKNVVEGGIILI